MNEYKITCCDPSQRNRIGVALLQEDPSIVLYTSSKPNILLVAVDPTTDFVSLFRTNTHWMARPPLLTSYTQPGSIVIYNSDVQLFDEETV